MTANSTAIPLAPRSDAGAGDGDTPTERASSLVESVLQPGRRGRKPGSPRTPGSGRKPGQRNRRTLAVEEAMRPLEPGARKTLRKLLMHDDAEVQL